MKYNLSLHYFVFLCFCTYVLSATADPATDDKPTPAQVMEELSQKYYKNTFSTLPHKKCTADNIAVRKEWDSLSKSERHDYLRAVRCLHSKPSKETKSPSRSRFEDFVLSHVQQTLFVHFSGLLLPWHRYLLFLYESALRTECNYKGYQPYWDWSKYLAYPNTSTVFDGSPLSFSTNGKYIPHGAINVTIPGGPPPVQYYLRPAGTGGGCITGGAFSNITLHLDADNKGASTPVKIFDERRCIKRDFYRPTLQDQNSYKNVTDLILESGNIHVFHPRVENDGIHSGGHRFIGGENLNLFTSLNDPVFYLHHAMVDRVWAIWQSRDPATREYALDGTLTYDNYPPSANATLDDTVDYGALAESQKIRDIISATHGMLCYVYE